MSRGELPMNAPFLANWTSQIRKGLLELMLLNDIGGQARAMTGEPSRVQHAQE
jgi:hypothetical protein